MPYPAGQSFFERAEIKDITCYLRLLLNGDDDLAFIRAITTPRRGIGAATLEALGNYAGQRGSGLFTALFEEGAAEHVAARQLEGMREFGNFINKLEYRAQRESAAVVLEDLLRAIGYEAHLFETCELREAETKWSNVRDFVDWLSRKGEEDSKNLLELAQTVALISMLDKGEEGGEAVQLATLHASKGLEFPHVFLVGVEEGLLPHQSSIDGDSIEEERRLMYVGVTRAKRSLTISHCERRKSGKEIRTVEPSRFIGELGEGLRHTGGKKAEPVSQEDALAKLAKLQAMFASKTPG